jgi:hypothetical protein
MTSAFFTVDDLPLLDKIYREELATELARQQRG